MLKIRLTPLKFLVLSMLIGGIQSISALPNLYKNLGGSFRDFSSVIMFDQAKISVYSTNFDFSFPFWTYNDKPDISLLCKNFSMILKPQGLKCVWFSETNRQIVLSSVSLQENEQIVNQGFTKNPQTKKEQYFIIKQSTVYDSTFSYKSTGKIILNNYSFNNSFGLFRSGLNPFFVPKVSFVDYNNIINQSNQNQFSSNLVSTDTILINYLYDSLTCSGISLPKYQTRTISNDKFVQSEQVLTNDTTFNICVHPQNLSLYYRFGESVFKTQSGYSDSLSLPIYAIGQKIEKRGFWKIFSSYDTSKFIVSGQITLKTQKIFKSREQKIKFDTIISKR